MMSSLMPQSGFRDFLNDEARLRLKWVQLISDVYQSFGFSPLETPALENLNLLCNRGGGEENEKLIFQVLKRGEKLTTALASLHTKAAHEVEFALSDLGLRFDLTLPLSRVIAAHREEIRLPWKVFHIGPVWRAERAQKGRFREFLQCDVDIIGAHAQSAEIEVLQAGITAIHQMGVSDFELRINDRRFLKALAADLALSESQASEFAMLLDKKEKISESEFLGQLYALGAWTVLPPLLQKLIENEWSLEQAHQLHPEAADQLESTLETLRSLNLPLKKVIFDPCLIRGMGYYTGLIFELRHPSVGYSFGGGGRYDQLIGRLMGQPIPACVFSIGFERLALLIQSQQLPQQGNLDSAALFLPVLDESIRIAVLKLAQKLRQLQIPGLRVDTYPESSKAKNQFKFAAELGYRWVCILGRDEIEAGVIKLKDFSSGIETSLSESQLLQRVRELFIQRH